MNNSRKIIQQIQHTNMQHHLPKQKNLNKYKMLPTCCTYSSMTCVTTCDFIREYFDMDNMTPLLNMRESPMLLLISAISYNRNRKKQLSRWVVNVACFYYHLIIIHYHILYIYTLYISAFIMAKENLPEYIFTQI